MTKMSRFLALLPVVAFAAACSGVAPTAPSQITSNDPSDAASGQATAIPIPICKNIAGVAVKIGPSAVINSDVSVVATYLYKKPVAIPCSIAPVWSASRRGLRVDPLNPFRASIPRSDVRTTTVTATAPNGVSGHVSF